MSGHEEPAPVPTESIEHSRYGSVISTRPLPLDVERRTPWNRWWHKAIHYWRYGYSHPDEDLLGVIEAVGDALHVQAITAKAVLSADAALEAGRIKDELDQELQKRLPDFSTLLGIESRINALYPPEMARRRQWVLRDRFDRVAPSGAMQYWQAERMQAQFAQLHSAGGANASGTSGESAADQDEKGGNGEGGGGNGGRDGGANGGDGTMPTPNPQSDSEADAQTLLGYIHTNYLMTIGREKAVRDLKRWLLMRFFFFLLTLIPFLFLVWVALWYNNLPEYWGLLLGLFLIAAAGRAGATTSVINRLQKAISSNVLAADPIVELAALRTGKNEISMGLLSSSIFALLMWAFFASGVPNMIGLDGGLFPRSIVVAADDEPSRAVEDGDGDGGKGESENAASPEPADAATQNTTITAQNSLAATAESAASPSPGQADSAKQPVPPPAPSATQPPASAGPTPNPAVTARAPAPRAAPRPPRPPRVLQFENRVMRMEDTFREKMAAHRAATGIFNWFERRSLRHEARAAIADAIANQDAVISFIERQETPAVWVRELRVARDKREQLVEMGSVVTDDESSKPSVGCEAGKDCNPFPDLATALRLRDESDFFKMLLWAFIAGFAERFVPDMLDRVVARGRGPKEAEADAALAAQVRAGTLPSSMPPQPPRAAPRAGPDNGT